MFITFRKFCSDERGDGLTGYLIVAIIAALVIGGVYVIFGKPVANDMGSGIGNQFDQSSNSLNQMANGFANYVH